MTKKMSENKKPRLCEILGVEAGEKFKFSGGNPKTYYIDEDGVMYCKENACYVPTYTVCYAINHPEEIIHMPPLAGPELAICKAAGAKWVTRNSCDHNHRFVNLWSAKPDLKYGIYTDTAHGEDGLIASFYDYCGLFESVKPGDRICVEEAAESGEK